MTIQPKAVLRSTVVAAGVIAASLSMTPTAHAATKTSWVGTTGPVDGTVYLHTSTISNTPLFADTRIYTAFGNTVPSGIMGVKSRLFKSGALCVIKPYRFNSRPAASLTDPTSGDCGAGSYNSHGFVMAWNGTDYQEFVTFPSDPLGWNPPAAQRQANRHGQTAGSARGVADDSQLPDLVQAYGTNGKLGYLRRADISEPKWTLDRARNLRPDATGQLAAPARRVPLYAEDGSTVIDEFQIG